MKTPVAAQETERLKSGHDLVILLEIDLALAGTQYWADRNVTVGGQAYAGVIHTSDELAHRISASGVDSSWIGDQIELSLINTPEMVGRPEALADQDRFEGATARLYWLFNHSAAIAANEKNHLLTMRVDCVEWDVETGAIVLVDPITYAASRQIERLVTPQTYPTVVGAGRGKFAQIPIGTLRDVPLIPLALGHKTYLAASLTPGQTVIYLTALSTDSAEDTGFPNPARGTPLWVSIGADTIRIVGFDYTALTMETTSDQIWHSHATGEEVREVRDWYEFLVSDLPVKSVTNIRHNDRPLVGSVLPGQTIETSLSPDKRILSISQIPVSRKIAQSLNMIEYSEEFGLHASEARFRDRMFPAQRADPDRVHGTWAVGGMSVAGTADDFFSDAGAIDTQDTTRLAILHHDPVAPQYVASGHLHLFTGACNTPDFPWGEIKKICLCVSHSFRHRNIPLTNDGLRNPESYRGWDWRVAVGMVRITGPNPNDYETILDDSLKPPIGHSGSSDVSQTRGQDGRSTNPYDTGATVGGARTDSRALFTSRQEWVSAILQDPAADPALYPTGGNPGLFPASIWWREAGTSAIASAVDTTDDFMITGRSNIAATTPGGRLGSPITIGPPNSGRMYHKRPSSRITKASYTVSPHFVAFPIDPTNFVNAAGYPRYVSRIRVRLKFEGSNANGTNVPSTSLYAWPNSLDDPPEDPGQVSLKVYCATMPDHANWNTRRIVSGTITTEAVLGIESTAELTMETTGLATDVMANFVSPNDAQDHQNVYLVVESDVSIRLTLGATEAEDSLTLGGFFTLTVLQLDGLVGTPVSLTGQDTALDTEVTAATLWSATESNRNTQKFDITAEVSRIGGPVAFFQSDLDVHMYFGSTNTDVQIFIDRVWLEIERYAEDVTRAFGVLTADIQGIYDLVSPANHANDPVRILYLLLVSSDFAGLSPGLIDATSWNVARSIFFAESPAWAAARLINKSTTIGDLIVSLCCECRLRLYQAGGVYKLAVLPEHLNSGAAVFDIDETNVMDPAFSKRNQSSEAIVNEVTVAYDPDYRTNAMRKSTVYTVPGSQDFAWGVQAKNYDALWSHGVGQNQAARLAQWLAERQGDVRPIVNVALPLRAMHLERADVVSLTLERARLGYVAGEIVEFGINELGANPYISARMAIDLTTGGYGELIWEKMAGSTTRIVYAPGRMGMLFFIDAILVARLALVRDPVDPNDQCGKLLLRGGLNTAQHARATGRATLIEWDADEEAIRVNIDLGTDVIHDYAGALLFHSDGDMTMEMSRVYPAPFYSSILDGIYSYYMGSLNLGTAFIARGVTLAHYELASGSPPDPTSIGTLWIKGGVQTNAF